MWLSVYCQCGQVLAWIGRTYLSLISGQQQQCFRTIRYNQQSTALSPECMRKNLNCSPVENGFTHNKLTLLRASKE